MSKESAIKFLRELRTNEKAKELLTGRGKGGIHQNLNFRNRTGANPDSIRVCAVLSV